MSFEMSDSDGDWNNRAFGALSSEEEDRILSDLGLSNANKLFAVLREPENGNLAFVVGTAHVSAEAAKDVSRMIAAVQPEIVAVELLGVQYGIDMLAAIQTAEQHGCKVVPIDRNAMVTVQRALMQWREQRKQIPEEQKSSKTFKPEDIIRIATKQAEEAGCENPEDSFTALAEVIKAAQGQKEVPVAALEKVRACGRLVVEKVRREPNSFSSVDSAFQLPAITTERDFILAQNLMRCAQEGTTVAVVGSGHLAGIRRRWGDALSQVSTQEAREQLGGDPTFPQGGGPRGQSSSSSIRGQGAKLGFLAAVGALAYYRPRVVARAAIVVGAVGVTGQLVFASVLAKAGRTTEQLKVASKKLEAETAWR